MLTDYHVHLRPDDAGAAPERYFTAENVDRYLDAARQAGIAELGVSEHVYRFTEALEISRHPLWVEQARDDLAAYCEFVRATPLRLGIEADYIAGAEDRIAELLDGHELDYVIGSVHMVGDRFVDYAQWDVWEGETDADRVWQRYFELLAAAAALGLFDVLAHPDLVKIWGAGATLAGRDLRPHYEPAVEAIAESGVAVELSTAGLRKPVGETYPSREMCEMCVEAGVTVRVSSDAHAPRGGRVRVRRRRAAPGGARGRGDLRLRAPATTDGAARMSAARRDRVRQPPVRRGPAAGAGRETRSRTSWGSPATPTPTAHPRRDRRASRLLRAGRPGAGCSRTKRSAGRMPTLRPARDRDRPPRGQAGERRRHRDLRGAAVDAHREEIGRNLSTALSAPVSVKATTNEGMARRPR